MTDKIQGFIETVRQMPEEKQAMVREYIQEMLALCVEATDGRKHAKVTFSYPPRGGENDGNPSLMAILSILPRQTLTVSENPYTRAKAVWLCHDFKVSFNQKQTKEVLTKALVELN